MPAQAQYQGSHRKNFPSAPASSKQHKRVLDRHCHTTDKNNPFHLPFRNAMPFHHICWPPQNNITAKACTRKHSFHSKRICDTAAEYPRVYAPCIVLHGVRIFHNAVKDLCQPSGYPGFLSDTVPSRNTETDSSPLYILPSDSVLLHFSPHRSDRSCDTTLRQREENLQQCGGRFPMKFP